MAVSIIDSVHDKQFRLAAYYLRLLRKVNHIYKQGGSYATYSINMVKQEWDQIKQLQNWAFEQRFNDEQAARLCSAYPQAGGELLDLMLSLKEQLAWRGAGLSVARHIKDRMAELDHLLSLAQIHESLDDYTIATDYTDQALKLAHQMRRGDRVAQGTWIMGVLKKDIGHYREAITQLTESLQLFHSYSQLEGTARCLIELGEIANCRGLYAEALKYYAEALQDYRQIDDTRGIAVSLQGLAATLYNQGEYETAKRYRAEAWQISTQIGDQWRVADILSELGSRTLGQTSLDEARQYCEESLQFYRQMGSRRGCAHSLMKLATIASVEQQHTIARLYCEEADQICREIGNRYGIVDNLLILAFVQQGLGEMAAAQANIVEALKITQEMDARIFIPRIFAAIANQLLLTGEGERGAMYYGLALVSPWLEAHLKDFAFPVLYEWLAQTLPADVLEMAIERGKTLDPDAALATILSEWG